MSDHLVGAAEVAEILGVSRQRVAQLQASFPGFPRPEVEVAAGRIWKREDIEEWVEKNRQRVAILRCSFCGKGEDEVRRLVHGSGHGVNICDQCAEYAVSIVVADEEPSEDPR